MARVGALNAAVSDPRFVVVIKLATIVDATQVLDRVVGLYDAEETIPVLFGFGFHKVVFVCERPPDVSISGEAGDGVFEVAVVGFGIHFFEAPAVVGMKEDEIGFDVEVAQVGDSFFEVVPEGGVEAGIVPAVFGGCLRRGNIRVRCGCRNSVWGRRTF